MGEVDRGPRWTLPLEISKVSTSYGTKEIFQDISLRVEPAEAFGLVGVNGAGKTTLIRSILGLREAAGAISFFGKSNAEPAARRNLIYLPEKFQPSPQLTGFEHLSILLDYFGQRSQQRFGRAMSHLNLILIH